MCTCCAVQQYGWVREINFRSIPVVVKREHDASTARMCSTKYHTGVQHNHHEAAAVE